MSKHERLRPDGRETLKLTEWERENLHLPPVTTVTLYEGAAPVEFLRYRLAMILEKIRGSCGGAGVCRNIRA